MILQSYEPEFYDYFVWKKGININFKSKAIKRPSFKIQRHIFKLIKINDVSRKQTIKNDCNKRNTFSTLVKKLTITFFSNFNYNYLIEFNLPRCIVVSRCSLKHFSVINLFWALEFLELIDHKITLNFYLKNDT